MQTRLHVKTLPIISQMQKMACAEPSLARPTFEMLRGFQSVILTASFMLAAVIVSAQSADFDALRRKAEAGDAKAQFDLAEAYSLGNGVSKDSIKGMEWLKKSAQQGFAGAQVVLGIVYQKGINIEKDPSEAARWYQKAARQGDKDPKHAQTAQNHLSEMLAQGSISAKEADWHSSEVSTSPKQPKKKGPSPFSLGELETGLASGITTRRMATLVSTYGVDFGLSVGARKRLISAGADDNLLTTIASSRRSGQ